MENDHNQSDGQTHHISSYRDHLMTLGILLVLTALTVGVSVYGGGMGSISVILALAVATAKALIVAAYFMHLKYDHKIYRYMVLIVVALFVVFMIVLSIDYSNR